LKKNKKTIIKAAASFAAVSLICSQGFFTFAAPTSPTTSAVEQGNNQTSVPSIQVNDNHVHNVVYDEGFDAGLLHTGLTEGSHCDICGEVLTSQTEIPMKSLTWSLSYGSYGSDVLEIQQKLYELGFLDVTPDGWYGDHTTAAVEAFQLANGLTNPDGIFGNWSLEAMRNGAVSTDNNTVSDNPDHADDSVSNDTSDAEDRLILLGYLDAWAEGNPESVKEAVMEFQLYNGLNITGRLDAGTSAALNDDDACPWRTLYYGYSGTDVYNIQSALISLGYLDAYADGGFGMMTYDAVCAFQEACGIASPDGIFGALSAYYMIYALSSGNSGNQENSGDHLQNDFSGNTDTVLSYGSYGDDVFDMQSALYELGFLESEPDGDFGDGTLTALKAFQWYNGFVVSGIADEETLGQLYYRDSMGFSSLYYGCSGYDVYLLEEELFDLGYLESTPDEYFDEYTEEAVNEFQYNNDIYAQNGVFGPMCLYVMMNDPAADDPEEDPGKDPGKDPDEEHVDFHEPVPSNAPLGEQIVDYAMSWVGVTPYEWAGNSLTEGTDCSGFTYLIYGEFGIDVPRGSDDYPAMANIDFEDLLPGDIVVYKDGGHVAIYAGDEMVVHCSTPESGTIHNSMWYDDPTGYIRVVY